MTPKERAEFISDIREAVHASQPENPLTAQEREWVRLAIQKEAQSISLRRAIIEKSLLGLVWAAIVFIGYVLKDWAVLHGYKN